MINSTITCWFSPNYNVNQKVFVWFYLQTVIKFLENTDRYNWFNAVELQLQGDNLNLIKAKNIVGGGLSQTDTFQKGYRQTRI